MGTCIDSAACCTAAECGTNADACNAGVCGCGGGLACSGGEICQAGRCATCTATSQCSGNTNSCTSGACTCSGAAACVSPTPYCTASGCTACTSASECPAPDSCTPAACIQGSCLTSSSCGGGTPFCSASGCAACLTAGDCTSPPGACFSAAGACSSGMCSYPATGGSSCVDTAVAPGAPANPVFGPEDAFTAFYSPTVLSDPLTGGYDMWAGGWLNQAGATTGLDQIFYASSTDLEHWTFQTGAPAIYDNTGTSTHYNDPSVVTVSTPSGLDMTRCQFIPGLASNAPQQVQPNCETSTGNTTYLSTTFRGAAGLGNGGWSLPPIEVAGLSGAPTNGGPSPTESWAPSALKISDDLVYLYFHDANGSVFRASIDPQVSFNEATDLVYVSTPNDPEGANFHTNVDVSLTPDGTFEMLYDSYHPCGDGGSQCSSVERVYSSDGIRFLVDPWFSGISAVGLSPPYSALTATAHRISASQYWVYFGWACEGTPTECGADGNAIGMQEWLFTEEMTH